MESLLDAWKMVKTFNNSVAEDSYTDKDMQTDDFHFWVPLISASIAAGAFEQATRRLASTGTFLQKSMIKLIPDHIRATRRKHLLHSKEKILKRMEQSGSDHKDFLYYLLKQQTSGSISTDEVIVNGALFMYVVLLWSPDVGPGPAK